MAGDAQMDGMGMGFAEVVPADGLAVVTLVCGACERARTWPAAFYSDRIRMLAAARRQGWGFLADGRRRCPVCQAIATRFGLRGSLAHELRRGGVHKEPESGHAVAHAVHKSARALHKAPVPLRAPPVTLQLDLFGA